MKKISQTIHSHYEITSFLSVIKLPESCHSQFFTFELFCTDFFNVNKKKWQLSLFLIKILTTGRLSFQIVSPIIVNNLPKNFFSRFYFAYKLYKRSDFMKRRRLQSYLFSFYLKTMVKINKIMTLPCYNLILLLFSEKKKSVFMFM